MRVDVQALSNRQQASVRMQNGAFFWLSAFYFVYFARPEDWVPFLGIVHMAKITGVLTMIAAFLSAGRTPRRIKDLPREAVYLLLLIAILFVSAVLSPVWRGGAFDNTVDFSKVSIAWCLTFLLVTTLARFRRIVFIQIASVTVISLVALLKGYSSPRLGSVIGGIYSNPNDLAFTMVLSLPFCVAFLLSAKNKTRKIFWLLSILIMMVALFKTGSRAGFIVLVIAGAVGLWHFGVKGKRVRLIVATVVVGVLMFAVFGDTLVQRFSAISDTSNSEAAEMARESYEQRRIAMDKAFDATLKYPILGLGAGNFEPYSGMWREVHMSYLQIACEGGIPSLILYLLIFQRGFVNLRRLRRSNPDPETTLFAGALHSSLIGFIVGASFAPVAYHYFPYFTVCYTGVLAAMAAEKQAAEAPAVKLTYSPRLGLAGAYSSSGRSRAILPSH